jgi:hypothetical protein
MKTRHRNSLLLDCALDVLQAEQPATLRQLFYRVVSRGELANSQREYKRLGKLMTRAREHGLFPRGWIVDHVRATLKPSSWSGLTDFADTVRHAYRKDFWESLDHHVEILVEKDAVAGTLQPITNEFDVALRVCRGYASVSFAGEIADEWRQIVKPIYAYYVGDFDPSGFDIERDLREKLQRYAERTCLLNEPDPGCDGFSWSRLAVNNPDFDEFDLVRLPVKQTDRRYGGFLARYGDAGAEVDALPPSELRRRVQEAIGSHIDLERWERLQRVEELERATMRETLVSLRVPETESRFSLRKKRRPSA